MSGVHRDRQEAADLVITRPRHAAGGVDPPVMLQGGRAELFGHLPGDLHTSIGDHARLPSRCAPSLHTRDDTARHHRNAAGGPPGLGYAVVGPGAPTAPCSAKSISRPCPAPMPREFGRWSWLAGLTALAVDVKKYADNNSGQVRKRSHEAAQGQVHKETQEVEERSRWRWSPRGLGVHRNQDRFISSKGARSFGRAPFLFTPRRRA
jgi:hypothetical protein